MKAIIKERRKKLVKGCLPSESSGLHFHSFIHKRMGVFLIQRIAVKMANLRVTLKKEKGRSGFETE